MKKDYIDISLIVDRSGSMAAIHDDVIGGLNAFIAQQKEIPGQVTVNVYEFDDKYNVVFENKDINELKEFTKKNFVPRGGTNIHDAVAKTILNRGKHFASLDEADRPEKVIVVIFTDGQHNVNGEFSKVQSSAMVKHQEEKYSWEVIYLGADQDAIAEGATMGIASHKTMNFNKNSFEVACRSASAYTSNYRSGKAGW